jgi:hypothetical protein
MIEKSLGFLSGRPNFLFENPHERALLDQSLHEKKDASSKIIKNREHEKIIFPNPIVKCNNENPRKQSKKNQEIGFRNKKASQLISMNLCNRLKAHVSSIESIKIHEDSDSKIEKFLAEEDLNCSKPGLNQPFDYVNNLPSCLKDRKGFTCIKLSQRLTVDSSDVLQHNYSFPQQIAPFVPCEVFLQWIGQYNTYIPILQARIKALMTLNESLANKNRELKANTQRQTKHLTRIGNIIIKNTGSVKAVINSEIL